MFGKLFQKLPWTLSDLAAKSIAGRLRSNETKAKIVDPVTGSVAVPVRGTDVLSVVVPTPAAIHAVRSQGRAHRISLRPAGIASVPVPAPLPHISVHII